MDPLSVTASIIAVAGIAASTGRAFRDLRTLCKTLPGRLHALSNEVADIELVLYQVASVYRERSNDPILKQNRSGIPRLLQEATDKLEDLRDVVRKLIELGAQTQVPLFQAYAWRKEQARLQALQEDIRTIKCNLNVLLGASNSQDMMRIRVDVKAVLAASSDSAQEQSAMTRKIHQSITNNHDMLAESIDKSYQRIEQRICLVEDLLKVQSMQLEASQLKLIGDSYGPPYRQKSKKPPRRERQHIKSMSTESVGVHVNQYNACQPGCSCKCHIGLRSATPKMVDRVLGQIFIGYIGLPGLSHKCNIESCVKSQSPQMSLEYWFPLGFLWSQIVRLRLTYEPSVGPNLELSMLRRVSDSAQCITFALDGNIDGLKDLFRRGLASPRDVSSTRGYSVLRWAMYGKQFQTCKFLVHAGADVDYRPIAASDNSPRNKAHQFLLMGGLSDDDAEALRCLTQDSDFVDEQNYTILHKIVLGLSLQNLEEQILQHPDLINITDAMGRTALAWASARGDERSIVTLLQYGAEVNTMDVQHSGVVGHAADRNYATCVRLLLEAGANPDIADTFGHKVGNPLNVAARNATDPLVLKTLLDFGANVDSCGVDGTTALIHATRKDNASFATLLLEYGANINAVSTAGQSPLTTAVAFNSHNVLQLLLDRWFEYSECPRLRGPHLLEMVALYADIKTITILTATDHLLIKHDQNYTIGDFTSRLSARPDATEKLIQAFEDLVSVISKDPDTLHLNNESLIELGLASSDKWGFNRVDTLGSDQDFVDALETLQINTKLQGSGSRPASPTGPK